jgi:histidyl-tRNA synthetase
VDKVLAAKINRIGIKKLPNVDKSLDRTQDVKLLQLEVDNQRKRLEQLNRDNDGLRVRKEIDHMNTAKQLEETLASKSTLAPIFRDREGHPQKVSVLDAQTRQTAQHNRPPGRRA